MLRDIRFLAKQTQKGEKMARSKRFRQAEKQDPETQSLGLKVPKQGAQSFGAKSANTWMQF